jgi:hypothetical protein
VCQLASKLVDLAAIKGIADAGCALRPTFIIDISKIKGWPQALSTR